MSENAKKAVPTKKKKRGELVFKPVYRGAPVNRLVLRRGLKLLLYQVIFVIFYLLAGAVLSSSALALRLIMVIAMLLICGGMVWTEGARVGETDASMGEIVYKRKQEGKPVSEKDLEQCYHPLRGVFTFLAAVLPLILICGIYALLAKREALTLPLPDWAAEDIGKNEGVGLAYYAQTEPTTVLDILRVIARTCIYPFVALVEPLNKSARLTVDRLSPLLVCVPFLAYIPAYILGIRSRARVQGDIAANERRVKRQREKAERRRTERRQKNQLI